MSNTPRTDAAMQEEPIGPSVNAVRMVELERELAAANAELEVRQAKIMRQKDEIAALEEKRREDIQMIHDEAAFQSMPIRVFIRAAFPDVFKEKSNEG